MRKFEIHADMSPAEQQCYSLMKIYWLQTDTRLNCFILIANTRVLTRRSLSAHAWTQQYQARDLQQLLRVPSFENTMIAERFYYVNG